jgi:DNA-binding MarR family transcriptional regulator
MSVAVDQDLAAELLGAWGGVRRRLRRGARQAVGGTPLTGSEIELLRLVASEPLINVNDAAAALHLAPNTVSTLVRSLTARALLDRRPDPGDRRAVRLALTPAASERLRRFRDERGRLLGVALAALDADDREALEASLPALQRLLAALEA